MPYKKSGSTSGARKVGRNAQPTYRALEQIHQIWLGVLVAYCAQKDTAVFVGTVGTTGSLRVNLYPPDDKCQASLSLREDWSEAIPAILSDVFEEEITEADILRAVPWAAQRAADAPLATRTAPKSAPAS